MTNVKHFYNESELVFKEKSKHGNFHDLTGQKFARLTVIGFAGVTKGQTEWFCKCRCKNITKVRANHLRTGASKSCGCFGIERTKETKTTHGHSVNGKESPTYRSWGSMLNRCQNPQNHAYFDYGGRGIIVCERWQKFENFLEDMGEMPKGMTIDRIDNEKGYFKENCRWADRKEQANNRRSNHFLTFNGKTQNVTQWAKETGIKRKTICIRINKLGWPVSRALTTGMKENVT